MIGVKYTGTYQDHSGYGTANRTDIAALFLSGIPITTELEVQVPEKSNFGWVGSICNELENRKIEYKIKIIHLTPDCYPRYIEKGKYNIGRLMWETDKLPKEWVAPCNQMQEIWTATQGQLEMLRNSGVKTPIFIFPQAIDIIPSEKIKDPFTIPNWNGYNFYAIFQWIERKNPKALLQTYWKTFTGNKEVNLILKTYRVRYIPEEFAKIKQEIESWKEELNLPHYPKVYLVSSLFTTPQIFRLHLTGDCFISTSRGEGWCIPSVEAGLMGKPIISIEKSGFADFLPKDNFLSCKTYKTSVIPVNWIPWYTSDQNWLEIIEEDLSKQMLFAYNNRAEAKRIGNSAQEFIKKELNFWAVGELMKQRLSRIEQFL